MENEVFYNKLKEIGLFFNSIIGYRETSFLSENIYDESNLIPNTIYDIKNDILVLNAKEKDGKNMYIDFLDKNLYSRFDFNPSDRNDTRIKNMILPTISVIMDRKTSKRKIHFNYSFLFIKHLNMIGIDARDNAVSGNYSAFLKRIKTELNDYVKSFNNCINQKPSKKDSELIVDKLHIVQDANNLTRKDIRALILIRDFIKKLKKHFGVFSNIIRNEEFNLDGFVDCFDIDKLYLVCAKCILNYASETHKIIPGALFPGINEVLNYVTKANDEYIGEYNPEIKLYDKENNKYYTYDFKTLKKDLNEYFSYFPKNNIKSVSFDEMKEHNLSKPKDIVEYLKNKENLDVLKASWEFIKKGESNEYIKRKRSIDGKRTYVDSESLEAKVNSRLEFFESTNYTAKIIGIDKFDGYVGYIYNDGTVIFEKFFEDMEKKKPAKDGNATYIMNIYNFTEFSKLSKPEIINYIKNNNDGTILRKYHTKNWENNINEMVKDIKIDIDVQTAINKLLDGKKIK